MIISRAIRSDLNAREHPFTTSPPMLQSTALHLLLAQPSASVGQSGLGTQAMANPTDGKHSEITI